MPVTPKGVADAISTAGPTLTGNAWKQVRVGVGVGVVKWALNPSNVVLQGSVSGVLGGGVVSGNFTLPSPATPVVGSLKATMWGAASSEVAQAVGAGIATEFSKSGMYTGTSACVGGDVSKVKSADAAALSRELTSGLIAAGITPSTAGQLAAGLAPGIATMFLTGVGTGSASGPAGPLPGTGTSKSSII